MRVEVTLAKNRMQVGKLQAYDDAGQPVLGPVNCLRLVSQTQAMRSCTEIRRGIACAHSAIHLPDTTRWSG